MSVWKAQYLNPQYCAYVGESLREYTKPEGQGAQVVLSVAVSLPGQEKGGMGLHSVSDLVTNLTSCICRSLDALFK